MIGNFPDHPFKDRPGIEPADMGAPCHAVFQTATMEVDGYDMLAQCGHTRDEHPHVEHHDKEEP
jgi:hypothetical protein